MGGIGTVIMFLGKLLISVSTALIFYLFVTYVTSVRAAYNNAFWQVLVKMLLCSWWE